MQSLQPDRASPERVDGKIGSPSAGSDVAGRCGGDFDEYMALFDGPLSESKREAIRMLFSAGSAIEGIQLVEGVELEV